jgi:protein SSD1
MADNDNNNSHDDNNNNAGGRGRGRKRNRNRGGRGRGGAAQADSEASPADASGAATTETRGRGRGGRGGGRRGGRGRGSGGGGGGGNARWNPEAFREGGGGGGAGGPNSQFKRKDGWEADRGDTFRDADGNAQSSSRSGHKYRGRKGLTGAQERGERDRRSNRGGDAMRNAKYSSASEESPAGNEHYQRRMRGGAQGGRRGPRSRFPPYWGRDEVEEGVASGAIYRGKFRVNARNRQHAYVTCDSLPIDVFIDGRRHQNRAFDGDVVAIVILDKSEWKRLDNNDGNKDESDSSTAESEVEPLVSESDVDAVEEEKDVIAAMAKLTLDDPNLQPAGRIVAVLEEKHNATQIGILKKPDAQMRECFARTDSEAEIEDDGVALPSNVKFVAFLPMDAKMPRCLVPVHQTPAAFQRDPDSWQEKLVQVDFLAWRDTAFMPLGRFRRVVGEAGDIDAETQALLIQYHVDSDEFSQAALADLPIQEGETWSIPEDEIARRRDLRETCIFTIDPATAKDLDDALSIRRLPNGNYEVGIHIADVSFFVQAGTELDRVARERSTSVYLTQMVIPMLPRVLCEDLCSLNPGVDRLAFSVFTELLPTGEVVAGSQWYGRSVIRSCVKLPYAFAQAVIEDRVKTDWQDAIDWLVEECYMHRQYAALPEDKRTVRDLFAPMPVYPDPSSGFKTDDVVSSIKLLAKLGAILRRRRFGEGSVALNNVKLSFHLDDDGNPIEAYSYITKEANNLVEEYMLLANQLVARRVVDAFPDRALLRNHEPPVARKLAMFGETLKALGFTLNAGSSKQFGDSMSAIQKQLGEKDADIFSCLQILAVRSMQTAKYLSTGESEPANWSHYALGFPVYTHFTSPIRRYPDLVVHRQLQAAISQDSDDVTSEQLLADIASVAKPADLTFACDIANEAKLNSRRAQEQSGRVYLCVLMGKRPTVETAVCVGVGERYLNVIVPRYGLDEKIYMEDHDLIGSVYNKDSKTVTLIWPKNPKTAGRSVGKKVAVLSTGSGEDSGKRGPAKKRLSKKQVRAARKEKRKDRRQAQRDADAAAAAAEGGAEADVAGKAEPENDDDISSSSDDSDDEEDQDPYEMETSEAQGGSLRQEIGLLTRFRVTIRKKANRVPIAIEFVPLHPDETAESIGAAKPVPVLESEGTAGQNDFEERH